MKAELISIGTELLLGEITDTNATYIAQQLREIGLDLIFKTTVGDNEQRIARVINIALDRVDVVITSGGLGPTVDDVTREAIARATGHPLVFSQELLDQIAERFSRFRVRMSENNRRQAYIPQGAMPVENPVGTAPIFILETERGVIMTLPGVPREMEYLLGRELLPWLKEHIGSPAVIKSLTLRTAGIGESQIDARIGDLMTAANPTVGLAAHAGQTDIRITAKAGSEDEAEVMIAPVEREIRQRLGDWIYGTGSASIEEAVGRLLAQQGGSVATVELGTQGLLRDRLQAVVSGEALKHSSVLDALEEFTRIDNTEESLEAIAKAAAVDILTQQSATYGVASIMQARGDLIGAAMAVATEGNCRSRYYTWTEERSDAHIWITTHALAMLRRMILRKSSSPS